MFQNGQVADATQVNANFAQIVNQVNANAAPLTSLPPQFVTPNVQVFPTHVVSQTYTTPLSATSALPLYLEVYMVGPGGGGAGSGETGGGTGGNGTNNTTFGPSLAAAPGQGGVGTGGGGNGGSGAGGSCNEDVGGSKGGGGQQINGSQNFSGFPTLLGGDGGGSWAFAPTTPALNGAGQTGKNGAGASGAAFTGSGTLTTPNSGGGGGGGEYCFAIITSPASSYLYTVGIGGTAGTAGTGGRAGAAAADGYIKVIARWQ